MPETSARSLYRRYFRLAALNIMASVTVLLREAYSDWEQET